MSLLIAIATYNERETLPSLVAALHEAAPQAEIFVIDDHSPDGTGQWCDEQAARCDWFAVRHRPGKLGLGSAAWVGFEEAFRRGVEFVATLDADWSHPPDALPQLASAAIQADVVIGSRYCPGGRIEGWPWSRRLVSRLMNRLTRLTLGVPARDCSTAFRLYRTAALAKIVDEPRIEAGYGYLEETLWRLHRHGATIVEVPIQFSERRAGQSKVSWREAWGKLRVLAQLARRRFFSATAR